MKPILVFQTDFTYKEGAVSSMYGVVKTVDRELEIMDGTHELPQYDTWSASYRLYQSLQFWPEGTIWPPALPTPPGKTTAASVPVTVASSVCGLFAIRSPWPKTARLWGAIPWCARICSSSWWRSAAAISKPRSFPGRT